MSDILFVDGRAGKIPSAVFICPTLLFGSVQHLVDKTADSLYHAIQFAQGVWRTYSHEPKVFIYDREPAVESLIDDIFDLGLEPILKAAGQHAAQVEVLLHHVRDTARSTKAGVYDNFGFKPPIQWNRFLVSDCIDTLNRRVATDNSVSLYEEFTGRSPDYVRDFQVNWGHPVVFKRTNRISADLDKEGMWGVPVRRYMSGSGVIRVYVVETSSYRHILKFEFANIPAWVIASLQSIPESQPIKYDEDDDGPPSLADFTLTIFASIFVDMKSVLLINCLLLPLRRRALYLLSVYVS